MWKRWSWRYRLGALFALMMLLQGASCPLDVFQRPTVAVPGVGRVIAEVFIDEKGTRYFLVEEITPSGARGFRRSYPGSGEHYLINIHLFGNKDIPMGGDRSGIPGGSGTLPLPAVQ